MTVEADLFAALGPLVDGRARPNTFKQDEQWPALRYSISTTPDVDICGDGGDATAAIRVFIEGVDRQYAPMRALRVSVMAAMKSFPIPAVLEGDDDDYDSQAKAHRCTLNYLLHPSSP